MSKIKEIIRDENERDLNYKEGAYAAQLRNLALLKALDVIADDLENIAVALYRMSAS